MAVDLSGECRRKQWMDTAPCGRPPRVRAHHPLLGKTDVWGMWMDVFVQTYYDELFICIHYVSVNVLYYLDIQYTYITYIYMYSGHIERFPVPAKKTEATCWMPGLMPISPIASGPGDLLLEKTTGWMRKIGSCEGWFLVICGDFWWFLVICGDLCP